ncbi:type II secretion system protein N [Pseudomonas maumuensis]|uniref:type II secretion system protein N n=1 Tax=Pseudomonas maumuensis TaxID=2842354 RepID=UPI001CEC41F7|nr:type II secretion system protein N [Pseudomonas maumuensis]
MFCLTLVVELPARWLVAGLRLPAEGVNGSVWQGQFARLGPVGPVQWTWRPWQRDLQVRLGFQGQGWQGRLSGWPWRWQVDLQALGVQPSVVGGYRLAGQWQGDIKLQGSGQRCLAAEGRITVADLALSAPWSLALGQGTLRMDCAQGWRLNAELVRQGQHRMDLEADLAARRAQVDFALQADAALTPVLRGLQWLGPEDTAGQRRLGW